MILGLVNLCAIHRNGNKHGRQIDSNSQACEREAKVKVHIIDASDECEVFEGMLSFTQAEESKRSRWKNTGKLHARGDVSGN